MQFFKTMLRLTAYLLGLILILLTLEQALTTLSRLEPKDINALMAQQDNKTIIFNSKQKYGSHYNYPLEKSDIHLIIHKHDVVQPKNNVPRILIVGDSLVEGQSYMNHNYVWPMQLKNNLLSDGYKTEVYRAGAGGYSAWDYYVTSGAYGWISVAKVWSSKDNTWYREINLCAEYLNRPVELVITTLMHEMVHLWNIQHDIQDTSRAGTYHNQRFKEVAEARGLLVEKSPKYGFCVTTPSPEFIELVKKHCRAGCFKLERAKTYRDSTPKVTTTGGDGKEKTVSRTKQSSRKYTCPECGLTVRATREVNVKCGDCDVTVGSPN
jgi:hypothetical protein